MTETEFWESTRKWIVSLNCGHTSTLASNNWYSYFTKNPFLPSFDLYVIGDRLFMREDFSKENQIKKGTEIIKIDGISSKEIIKQISSIQQRDGYQESFVKYNVNKTFRTYYTLLNGILTSNLVTYITSSGDSKEKEIPTGLKRPKGNTFSWDQSKYVTLKREKYSHFYIPKEDSSYAEIDLNSFYRKGYKKFYKSVFKEIKSRGIKKLIIDLRNNGGGYFPNGNELLTYLIPNKTVFEFSRNRKLPRKSVYLKMDKASAATKMIFGIIPDRNSEDPKRNYSVKYKPKKKLQFKGQIYVLTNGGSFSMSGYVAAKLRHHSNAVFIGEETGGGEIGSNAVVSYTLTLPNSGVRVIIPSFTIHHSVSPQNKGRGVIPDYTVNITLNDFLKETDKTLERAKEIMKKTN